MTLNSRPIRAVNAADVDAYERDGVVCLRQVIEPSFIEQLGEIAKRIVVEEEDVGLLPTLPGRYLARRLDAFRQLIFKGPIGEATANVLQSKEIRFYFDEFFAKTPRSTAKTIWHNDRMGWPVSGLMVPSIWIPLTPISKDNCLEVLAGSQSNDEQFWLSTPNARKMVKPAERAVYPDVESERGDPKHRFLKWDMELGDLLIVHPWVLHYSGGNPLDIWRIALSIRVFGDDIRWSPRPDCLNLAGVSFDEMIEGQKPMGPMFPLMWSEDGRRDDDRLYPRGFATQWEGVDRAELNPYKVFADAERDAIAERRSKNLG